MAGKKLNKLITIIFSIRIQEMLTMSREAVEVVFSDSPETCDSQNYEEY